MRMRSRFDANRCSNLQLYVNLFRQRYAFVVVLPMLTHPRARFTFYQEVMDVLDRETDSQAFLEAFNAVQTQLQDKRSERKRSMAAEAITNPHAFAKRKLTKKDRKSTRLNSSN